MRLKRRVRLALRRMGVDVTHFPAGQPMHYLVRQLQSHGISCVFDIGANEGEFARDLRRFGYAHRIVSFEPVPALFERTLSAAATDPQWDVVPYALGEESRVASINVAGNGGASSSLLPMLDFHRAVRPQAAYVATCEVTQRALDEVWSEFSTPVERVYLKVDVQGYERFVLAGARELVHDPRVRGVQLEMSLVPLYAGAWTYRDTLDWAASHGFELAQLIPGFTDAESGRMLQADGVFFRDGAG